MAENCLKVNQFNWVYRSAPNDCNIYGGPPTVGGSPHFFQKFLAPGKYMRSFACIPPQISGGGPYHDLRLKMTWKQPFLDIGCLPDDLLLESNSKSSLLFDKYHPDLHKMKFWQIAISGDGYQKVHTWGWKWHENSYFWTLVACLMISFWNLTQNQVFLSTNTILISRKWNFE